MPAADMQLIVHDVSTGHEVRDHCQAVAAVGTGRPGDILTIHHRRRGSGIEDRGLRGGCHGQSIQGRALDELYVGDRRGTRRHGHGLCRRGEIRRAEAQDIVAERHRHE